MNTNEVHQVVRTFRDGDGWGVRYSVNDERTDLPDRYPSRKQALGVAAGVVESLRRERYSEGHAIVMDNLTDQVVGLCAEHPGEWLLRVTSSGVEWSPHHKQAISGCRIKEIRQ